MNDPSGSNGARDEPPPGATCGAHGPRIPILRDVTRLKVVHRQRVLRGGDADPPPAFDPEGLAPLVRAKATEGWMRLVETEYESIVIGSWMSSALARHGAPLDIIGAFGRVVEDEIRHVDIAAHMVEALGGRPSVPRAKVPPFPVNVDGTGSQEAEFELMAGLVGFFCIFEHLSAHVFRQALDAAETEVARWAIGEIHRDEAFHGAFGFETAKLFVPKWPDAQRRRLSERVLADIGRFERRLGGPLVLERPVEPAQRELDKLGLLGAPDLLAVFYAAVEQELVPRLDDLGIPLKLEVGRAR